MRPVEDYDLCLECLPPPQRRLWPRLSEVPGSFDLYGGTALALQLGHRPSYDFDFFGTDLFNAMTLYGSLRCLEGARIDKAVPSDLRVTLPGGTVDGKPLGVSFRSGNPPSRTKLRDPLLAPNGIRLASVLDIFGCKCETALWRGKPKDFQDICAILQRTQIPLAYGLAAGKAIYHNSFSPRKLIGMLSGVKRMGKFLTNEEVSILLAAVDEARQSKLPDPSLPFPGEREMEGIPPGVDGPGL